MQLGEDAGKGCPTVSPSVGVDYKYTGQNAGFLLSKSGITKKALNPTKQFGPFLMGRVTLMLSISLSGEGC